VQECSGRIRTLRPNESADNQLETEIDSFRRSRPFAISEALSAVFSALRDAAESRVFCTEVSPRPASGCTRRQSAVRISAGLNRFPPTALWRSAGECSDQIPGSSASFCFAIDQPLAAEGLCSTPGHWLIGTVARNTTVCDPIPSSQNRSARLGCADVVESPVDRSRNLLTSPGTENLDLP
jgi:hypothetical protein